MEPVGEKKKIKKRKYTVESVDMISVKKHLAHPALVTFRTAPPPLNAITTELHREQYSAAERSNHKYVSELTVTAGEGYIYKGQNHLRQNSNDDVCLIGILNNSTGTMKLVEAEQFSMAPDVKAFAEMDKSLRPFSATQLFGTKKSRHKLNMIMQERERVAGLSKSAVEKALPHVEEENLASLDQTNDFSYFLPKINTEATTADDIYKLRNIVDDSVLEFLVEEAEPLLTIRLPDLTNVSPLFLKCLAAAKLEMDQSNKLRLACASIMVEYLCKIASKTTLPKEDMDTNVLQHLTHTYKLKNKGHHTPDEMRDKALAHLLILSLLICSNKISADSVMKSVNVRRDKLETLVKMMRLTKKGFMIALQVPLPPPIESTSHKTSVMRKNKRK